MISFELPELTCECFVLGPMKVNTCLVYNKNDTGYGLLIDPAEESQTLLERIKELDITDVTIFLTHGHADHLYGVDFFRRRLDAPVIISKLDAPMLTDPDLNLSGFIGEEIVLKPADRLLKAEDQIKLGNITFETVAIPGHTPGGTALISKSVVFSGDTLFAGSIGRSDLPGGNGQLLIKAIKNSILNLSNRLVLPGHGPETNIDEEKNNNPFLTAEVTV